MPKERYYQSSKDRMDESSGMKNKMEKEFYDSGMIRADRSAVANLPQEVIMREYPKGNYGYGVSLDDTASGIDKQIKDDSKEMKRDAYPEKY